MGASYAEIIFAGCILLLPFLYESSHAFRYYLKFLIYYLVIMIYGIILIPVMLLRPCDTRNFLIASTFCKTISKLIGLQWILRGKEHLEQKRACIIVSNHQSSIDVLGMFDIWHVMNQCTVVAKKELLYTGPFGVAAWLCGIIFIDRVHSNSARDSVNHATDIIKQKLAKLWVFPEGTRRNTGEIHAFKKGAFHMAISAQIPILPIVYSRYYFLDKRERRFDSGKVIITTLSPISTTGMTVSDVDTLLHLTHSRMAAAFIEVNREIC